MRTSKAPQKEKEKGEGGTPVEPALPFARRRRPAVPRGCLSPQAGRPPARRPGAAPSRPTPTAALGARDPPVARRVGPLRQLAPRRAAPLRPPKARVVQAVFHRERAKQETDTSPKKERPARRSPPDQGSEPALTLTDRPTDTRRACSDPGQVVSEQSHEGVVLGTRRIAALARDGRTGTTPESHLWATRGRSVTTGGDRGSPLLQVFRLAWVRPKSRWSGAPTPTSPVILP